VKELLKCRSRPWGRTRTRGRCPKTKLILIDHAFEDEAERFHKVLLRKAPSEALDET
jgi:hypothetical protein